MKKLLCCACAAALSMAAAIPCFAAGSPWDGTWKLNEAKSKMTGGTVDITKNGDMYMVNTGSFSYKFACDGKDYPVLADRTAVCTGGPRMFTDVMKINGKVYETTKHEISADGKTMTSVSTGTHPDGTAFTDRTTDIRVGSGTGLAGTWKSTKVKNSVPDVMVLKVNGNVLHYESPGFKEVSNAKLDGAPAPITGGTAPPGLMISNKADGPDKLASSVMLNGKNLGKDVMTLSPDGKTITDVSWTPGKESEKQVAVYDKQ
jgi:hypothetical protein